MKKLGYSLALAVVAVCCINMGTGGDDTSRRSTTGEEKQDIYLKRGEAIIFASVEDGKTVRDVKEVCFHDPGNKACWVDGIPFGIEKFRVFPVGKSGFTTLTLGDVLMIELLEDDMKRREVSDPDSERKGKFAILNVVSKKDPETGSQDSMKVFIHSDVMISYKYQFGAKEILHQVPLIEVDRIVIEKREGTK